MATYAAFKKRLRPGQVYRRAELAQWSHAVDRHLREMLTEGAIKRLARGLYLRPKDTVFGSAPAEDHKLIKAVMGGGRFLLVSPNLYNRLGVGTTQLYNKTVVYNHKRRGHVQLGGRTFEFRVKSSFPSALSREFLLVDLVNNLDQLPESKKEVLEGVRRQATSCDVPKLRRNLLCYGNAQTKKFFSQSLGR